MTPASTYRLQLHKGFTFEDAADIADYLKALGISHVYSSPYLQAAPGSMHGYDVVDHRHVNEELGGAPAHERFCSRLGDLGLGQVLDIVPNHMSLAEQNAYWRDVLENGTSSRYANFFDIDWNSPEERLRDKVLVPVLGNQYGRVLEDGGIRLARLGSEFHIETAGQNLPVSPESLAPLLDRAAEQAKNDKLKFLAASFARLPRPDAADRRSLLERHRDKGVLMGLLDSICDEDKGVCAAIDHRVAELNIDADAMDDFLNQQHYRLAYWKAADQQLGYRRFFDVNTLIGLRVEREYVFEETHALVTEWLKRGVLDGVRVDHPDGLRDPKQYFERLRERAPQAWIIGEKILARGEMLPESWPIEGTSGYDFMNMASGLLVSPRGLRKLGSLYAKFTGETTDFAAVAHEKKLNVTQETLGSDVNRLTGLFIEICECNRKYRDFTRSDVRRGIRELVSCFAVYRTYVVPERNEISEKDVQVISSAVAAAKANRTDIDGELFDFLGEVLSLKVRGAKETEFVQRFQQFTSPVMAKGVEDTAFYCFNRLIGLCEVGADPGRDGVTANEFHEYNIAMQKTHPESMVGLSTHDTKRSDDVRARLAVLSEIPEQFVQAAKQWSKQNSGLRDKHFPDKGTEWFLFQTMIGAWPISGERLKQYIQKAMREAKAWTSWVAPNAEAEATLDRYIDAALADKNFTQSVEEFISKISEAGRINSLTQTLLKYTVPGVPDLYQGGELWDLSLVDPDNRRPVDYSLRRDALATIEKLDVKAVMTRMSDGLPKLWVIQRSLHLRNEHRDWFDKNSGYAPITAHGAKADHVVAFQRGEQLITVVPRLTLSAESWVDTTIQLPPGLWSNLMTGSEIVGGQQAVSKLFREFPVALLVKNN